MTNGDARLDTLEEALRTRARVVAAGDRQRRRIEGDLYDGVQLRLTGVAVQLATTQAQVRPGHPEAAESLGVLRGDLREAIVELRDFAHGIYPPALTQRGLSVALRSVVGRLPQLVRTDHDRRWGRPAPSSLWYMRPIATAWELAEHVLRQLPGCAQR